ncbi:hypothetical protein [Algivirga pacifica]|uniref:hypothetical protein n=1 Tax=Algivirga pacifica TaxID=1162670 RepID=UPI0031ED1285
MRNRLNEIRIYVLLGVFSLMILQHALPHTHHEHEEVVSHGHSHSSTTSAHHHHHSTGHHKKQHQSKKELLDFFALLVENYSHLSHAHHYTSSLAEEKESSSEEYVITLDLRELWNNNFFQKAAVRVDSIATQYFYQPPFSDTAPLRGPPAFI